MFETMKEKDLMNKIKNQSVKNVHSRFSIETCICKIEEVYDSVLK
jgi:hypothetical protein